MNQRNLSDWPEKEKKAGKAFAQAWETFFADRGHEDTAVTNELGVENEITALQNRVQESLLQYPNVVAVAEGTKMKNGQPTNTKCLVVYVSKKVPESKLKKAEIIPDEIDGIPLDVVEVGQIKTLPK